MTAGKIIRLQNKAGTTMFIAGCPILVAFVATRVGILT